MIKYIRTRIFSSSAAFTAHEWVLASCFFSGVLLAVRIIVTQKPEYIFLPWNLFLAFIPYQLARWVMNNVRVMENKFKLIGLLFVWLLFIPNSFYIITDLFHLAKARSAPQWFDLLLIFSFAWNGILFGILSLRKVEMIIRHTMGRSVSFFIVLLVMWLIAFGIYIGRFLRFNSWDVLTDPFSLAAEMTDMVFHPFAHGYAWGMTVCYAVFMTLLYFTIKKLGSEGNK